MIHLCLEFSFIRPVFQPDLLSLLSPADLAIHILIFKLHDLVFSGKSLLCKQCCVSL